MCGPVLAWDWYVLDFAYVLALAGGTLVLRAKIAMPVTWLAFGLLSAAVGAFLFSETYTVQAIAAAPMSGDAMNVITSTTASC